MNVFISWSGERSKAIAQAWERLLKDVLPQCESFVSTSGIEAGEVWFSRITGELDGTSVGISCLTPENRNAPWILFEAGALSKRIEKARLCCFLFELTPSEVAPPLSMFHLSEETYQGVLQILKTINNALGRSARTETELTRAFDAWWPEFEKAMLDVKKIIVVSPERRTERSMMEEILELARADARANGQLSQRLERLRFHVAPEEYGQEMAARFATQPVHVEFEGGIYDRKHIAGSAEVDQSRVDVLQTGMILWATKGEIGGIFNAVSDLSLSVMEYMSEAVQRRFVNEIPEAYGFQAYELVEKKEKGSELHLKMKYIPPSEWKAANQRKREREEKNKEEASEPPAITDKGA